MKYVLTIICAVLVCFYSTAQDRFKVTIGSGIGSYKMDDLKKFQQAFIGNGDLLETVDNFPMYFFYSGEVSYSVGKGVGLGLIYRLQSTGAASSYADYSGVYRIEQQVMANCAGILFDFNLLEKNKLKLSLQIRAYHGWTTMKISEYLNIYSFDTEVLNLKGEFKSTNIMTNPDITIGYEVFKNTSINLSAGYCIDFKGDLKTDSGFYLPNANGEHMQSDWSGIRIGLSASYRL